MSCPTVDIPVADLEADPYPIYARLRIEAPAAWVPSVAAVLITRGDDVQKVLIDDVTFTSEHTDSPLRETLGPNLLTVGPEDHLRMLRAFASRLRTRQVETYAPGWSEQIAASLLDRIEPGAEVELMAEYCEPLSALVLARLIGIEDLGAATLRRWFSELATGGGNYEHDPAKFAVGQAAATEVDQVLATRMAARQQGRGATLLADMIAAETLSEPEILGNVKLMILGGMQEPAHTLGSSIGGLLIHPGQLDRVRSAGRWQDAIEETLRWMTPVGTATRTVARSVEIGEAVLSPGMRVAAVLASANRDPASWADPDLFDIDRERRPHRAFGAGSHFCIGYALARSEMATGLRMLFERFPALELAAPVKYTGWEFRGPCRVRALAL